MHIFTYLSFFSTADKKFLAFFFRRVKRNTSGKYEDVFPFISPCGPETNYIRCDDLPVVFTQLLDQDGQEIEDVASYGHTDVSSSKAKAEMEVFSLRAEPKKWGGAESQNMGGADLSVLTDDSSCLRNSISNELIDAAILEKSSSNSTHEDAAPDACLEKLSYGGAGNLITFPFQPKNLFMLPGTGRVYHAGPDHLGGVGLVKSSLAIELSRLFVYEEQAEENSPPTMFRWRGKKWKLENTALQLLLH